MRGQLFASNGFIHNIHVNKWGLRDWNRTAPICMSSVSRSGSVSQQPYASRQPWACSRSCQNEA
jgi:hypothetical protein